MFRLNIYLKVYYIYKIAFELGLILVDTLGDHVSLQHPNQCSDFETRTDEIILGFRCLNDEESSPTGPR